MSQEHQRKTTATPASVAPKKAPAPIPKDPASSHTRTTPTPSGDPNPGDSAKPEWVLDAPPTIEIYGAGKNQVAKQSVWIPVKLPSTEHHGPRFRVAALSGDWLTARSASAVLPVAGESTQMHDAKYAIELVFNPPEEGVFQSTLEIEVLDAPSQTFLIPIKAHSEFGQVNLKAPPSRPPQPAPTKKPPEKKMWEINAPTTIELVGSGKGQLVSTDVLISARLPESASPADRAAAASRGPQVMVTVSDGSAITIRSAPMYLPVEGVSPQMQDPAYSLVLDFLPVADLTLHETLEIQVLDGPYQSLSIPIVAHSDFRQRAGKPLSTLKPDVKSGRITLPNHVHLGDTVVGSRNAFTVASPRVTGGHGGTADLRSIDPQLSSPTAGAPDLELPGGRLRSTPVLPKESHLTLRDGLESRMEVVFAPDRPGSFTEALEVKVAWDDNNTETHRISITALAHGLKDLAWKDRAPAPLPTMKPATPHELTKDESSSPEHAEYRKLATRAATAGGLVADAQARGVNVAKDEVASFHTLKPPAPWWMGIIEIAMFAGISGVAAVVARNVAQSIATKAFSGDLGKIKDAQSVVFGTDAIKESMKQAGKAAIIASPTDKPASILPTADFFARQHRLCGAVKIQNLNMVYAQEDQLTSLFAISPHAAIETMKSLKFAFEEAEKKAEDAQALATHVGWMQALARERLGTDTLTQDKLNLPSREVTSVRPFQNADPHGRTTMVDGVLSISIGITDFHGDIAKIQVYHSKVIGISNAAAFKLQAVRISDLPLPLSITGNWGGSVSSITRDEAGRVRVAGRIPHSSGTYTELDMHRNAGRIVELLGAHSLDGWGVALETNDGTKVAKATNDTPGDSRDK